MNPRSGLRLGWHIFGSSMRLSLAAFWLIVGTAFLTVPLVLAAFGVQMESSIWENVQNGAVKYFFMALGVMLTGVFMPQLIAHGITRRRALGAGMVVVALIGVTTGLLVAVGYQLEGLVFSALGWPQGLALPHLFDSPTALDGIVIEAGLMALVHAACGWLIGSTYYRWGGWVGSLALPLTAVPIVVAELAMVSGWIGAGLQTIAFPRLSPPVAVAVALAATCIALVANHLLVRDIPIRTSRFG